MALQGLKLLHYNTAYTIFALRAIRTLNGSLKQQLSNCIATGELVTDARSIISISLFGYHSITLSESSAHFCIILLFASL